MAYIFRERGGRWEHREFEGSQLQHLLNRTDFDQLPSTLNLSDRWSNRKARVGDYAEVVRQVRNLAHPARYVADHYRSRVTAKYLKRQFDMVLLCRDWLSERNNKSLLEHMKAEGIL